MMADITRHAPGSDPGACICILLNEGSGKQDEGPSARDVAAAFARHDLHPRIVPLDPDQTMDSMVQGMLSDGADTIIAAGGDGTISGVAQALLGEKCRFGILPRGTFNYFARSLGVPQDLDAAVEVIAAGKSRPLRVAMLNNEVFLNNANFGLYPQILRSREDIYDFWGRSRGAAYWSALKVLFRWPRPLDVTLRFDGREEQVCTPMVFVLNNAFQLRQMGMDGAQCIEDGKLAMLVAPDKGRLGMLRSALKMLAGRAAKHRDFHLHCAEDFTLEAQRTSLLVACDGERRKMKGPFRLTLSGDQLDILVPRDATEGTR